MRGACCATPARGSSPSPRADGPAPVTTPDFLDDVARDDRRSRTVVLPDGRRLGYAEWGDARGRPLLFFHGTPSSRLGLEWAEDAAGARRVRVLSIDRPGHGL